MSISDGKVVYDDNKNDANSENIKAAYFAGGCFWCVESDFHKIRKGLISVTSGYAGGEKENPTYHDHGDHLEAVEVKYDSSKIDFNDLVSYFFRHIDPTDEGGQFYDRGHSYTTAVFYQSEKEKEVIQDEIDKIEAMGIFDKPIATKVLSYKNFYPAEDYHQRYSEKNPDHYKSYREGSGRQEFIEKYWDKDKKSEINNSDDQKYKKPSESELKDKLTDLEYAVTQNSATEPAFHNEFWDHDGEGIYVDKVTGEPLYSSKDKFDSDCGWPSFTKPIDKSSIMEKADYKLFIPRIEVRSKNGDTHLGHVFNDGPAEHNGEKTEGLRYCINSAALRFIPKENLEKEGYGEYLNLFK